MITGLMGKQVTAETPVDKATIRKQADQLARDRFGMSAAALGRSSTVAGTTGESAAAQRIAFMARYASK